jgi:hypothetical protein
MMSLEIAAQQFFVWRAQPARVVLAPGALSPAHRLTGPLGQIRRTEAVEVDFGQSFEEKKVTSRVSARPFPTSPRFRSPPGWRRSHGLCHPVTTTEKIPIHNAEVCPHRVACRAGCQPARRLAIGASLLGLATCARELAS